MLIKFSPLLLLFLFPLTDAYCQGTSDDDEKEIMKVVLRLFDGMRAGDSSMVRSVFHDRVEMYTSFTDRNGKPDLKKDDVEKFIAAVGTPHDEVWDEPIWDAEVRIDGNLAQVWTKYAFYAGKRFSHCGVDAFHLTRTGTGWKIFHLTDTRQKEGCEVPESIREERK